MSLALAQCQTAKGFADQADVASFWRKINAKATLPT
jgi:hypothetical protein